MSNITTALRISMLFTIFSIACSDDDRKSPADASLDDGGDAGAKGVVQGDAGATGTSGRVGSNGGASGTAVQGGGGNASGGNGAWGTLADSSVVQVQEGGVPITLADGGTVMCYRIACNEKILECGDCEENDSDGLVDSMDPQCLGPCDNTEGPALEPGIGGDTGDQCKRDCYFDYGNGPGNDDCHWAYSCDPLAPKDKCDYDQSRVGGSDCPNPQSKQCLDLCLPVTPNGCDCFGCCTFPELAGKGAGGKDRFVWIGRTEAPFCTFGSVNDDAACPPCTPEPSCLNTCGRCEICIGKTTIPSDCIPTTPDGGVQLHDGGSSPDAGTSTTDGGGDSTRCSAGIQACGLPGDTLCQADEYCITGCCVQMVLK